MPFDINWPPDHAELDGAPFRNQFNGLKDMVDAVPTSPEMASVIADNSASNVNGVMPLNLTISDPPTRAEVQAVVDKMNELITSAWR